MSLKSQTAVKSVGVRELRQDASSILKEVKAGEVIEITEHGRPIARIIPVGPSLYEEAIEAELIIPRVAEPEAPWPKSVKLKGSKSSLEHLMADRAAERN